MGNDGGRGASGGVPVTGGNLDRTRVCCHLVLYAYLKNVIKKDLDRMRQLAIILTAVSLFALVLAAAPVYASQPGQDEPTPTHTPTPGAATATYQAAYEAYTIIAMDKVMWVIMGEVLCGVLFVGGLAIGVITFLKRRRHG
jgi:hypothetical protein